MAVKARTAVDHDCRLRHIERHLLLEPGEDGCPCCLQVTRARVEIDADGADVGDVALLEFLMRGASRGFIHAEVEVRGADAALDPDGDAGPVAGLKRVAFDRTVGNDADEVMAATGVQRLQERDRHVGRASCRGG